MPLDPPTKDVDELETLDLAKTSWYKLAHAKEGMHRGCHGVPVERSKK